MATLQIEVTVDEDGNFKLQGEDASGDMVEAFDDIEEGQAHRVVRLTLEIDEAQAQELTAKIAHGDAGAVTLNTSDGA